MSTGYHSTAMNVIQRRHDSWTRNYRNSYLKQTYTFSVTVKQIKRDVIASGPLSVSNNCSREPVKQSISQKVHVSLFLRSRILLSAAQVRRLPVTVSASLFGPSMSRFAIFTPAGISSVGVPSSAISALPSLFRF